MQEIRINRKLDFIIDNMRFLSVSRNAGFMSSFKTGKPNFSLIFVECGEMKYYFTERKKTIALTKGSTLFIPEYTPYLATYTEDNTQVKLLGFEIISNNLPSFFDSVVHKKEDILADIFDTISAENAQSAVFLAAKIYELLFVIEKEEDEIPDKYKKIIPALNEIQKFYYENKKISYYSDMCYMSESNFRKLFKEYTGKSFIEYRNILRISKAKEMIASGEFTVTEAANLTGFNNMSFFYEVLNRYV